MGTLSDTPKPAVSVEGLINGLPRWKVSIPINMPEGMSDRHIPTAYAIVNDAVIKTLEEKFRGQDIQTIFEVTLHRAVWGQGEHILTIAAIKQVRRDVMSASSGYYECVLTALRAVHDVLTQRGFRMTRNVTLNDRHILAWTEQIRAQKK